MRHIFLKGGQFTIDTDENGKLITRVHYKNVTDQYEFAKYHKEHKLQQNNVQMLYTLGYEYVGDIKLIGKYHEQNWSPNVSKNYNKRQRVNR